MNKDAADIARAFARIPDLIKSTVQPAIDKGADEIAARARYLAPDDTGELAASIRRESSGQPLSATVVTDNPHALYQEFGTAKMDRNSFFWPSVNSLKKRVRSRIDRAISKAVRQTWSN